MSELSNEPVMPVGPEPFFKIWIKALTKPNEQTFAELAASPSAKATTGYLWYFVAMLIQLFFASLVPNEATRRLLEQYGSQYGAQLPASGGFVSNLISAICGAPIMALIGTLLFALGVALIQWIARMFGGRGTNDQLVYAMSAIVSPFALVSTVLGLLGAIPFVGLCFSLISLLAAIYIIVLEVMAVKGVNQFGWGQALGSFFIPALAFACLCACLVGGTIALIGPVIGDTFRQIQQGLGQ